MSAPEQPQVRLNHHLLPILAGVLILLQLIVPFRGWVILLVALGGAWLVARLWAHSLARGLRLTREVRFGWAQVGDRIEERFTLLNSGWAPALWAEIADLSTLPGHRASRATGIGGHSENQWSLWNTCLQRGAFRLGPTTLTSGDPFGIYTVTIPYSTAATMLVMPPVVSLPDIAIAPGGRAGEGRRRVEAADRTVSAFGVRDYNPGDSLRWIHWATTAHRDALSVRLFDSAPTSDWWIFVDLDTRVQAGSGRDSTLEHAVIIAASLADGGLRSGRGVGLVAQGSSLAWLPPQTGEPQRWQLLRALALVDGGVRSLRELLSRTEPALRRRASLIVITPAVSGEWVQCLLTFIRRGITPTVLLLDRASYGGTDTLGHAQALLSDLGIAHHVISKAILDTADVSPGRAGQWDWRVAGAGRAVAVHRPQDFRWKVLG